MKLRYARELLPVFDDLRYGKMAKKTKEKTKPQKPPKEPKQKKTKDARYSKRRKVFCAPGDASHRGVRGGGLHGLFPGGNGDGHRQRAIQRAADPGRCLRGDGGQHDPHALGADRPAHL